MIRYYLLKRASLVHAVAAGAKKTVCGEPASGPAVTRGRATCAKCCAKLAADRAALDALIGVLSRPAKKNPSATEAAAAKAYVETHWGEGGEWMKRASEIVDVDHGALVLLGALEAATYSTVKGEEGGGEIVNYEHDFESTLPLLCFHACSRPRCPSRGKLAIVGGTYRVTERGIVG